VPNLFEEYLTLGPWLAEGERLAIYKFLLRTKRRVYKSDALMLLERRTLKTIFANGEIAYEFMDRKVSFKTRELGDPDFDRSGRSIKISKIKVIAVNKLVKFFAQAETDVLRNYPILKEQYPERRGYSMNVYPYYDLNYYSRGRGVVIGFLKKIQRKDDLLLEKLLASSNFR
jgi:hypothetical protein